MFRYNCVFHAIISKFKILKKKTMKQSNIQNKFKGLAALVAGAFLGLSQAQANFSPPVMVLPSLPSTPPVISLELIPCDDNFLMGNPYVSESSDEAPIHSVYVSDFEIGAHEISKEQWDQVKLWGSNNGYTDLSFGQVGSGSGNTSA